MRKILRLTYRLSAILVAGLTALALTGLSAVPARAAAASYQLGCYPYGNPDYAFEQFISGWGYHVGEDVCQQVGMPVYAAADGQVMYSAQTPGSYRWGNLIIIQHQNIDGSTAVSLYGHLGTDRRVSVGNNVAKGQRIGTVGPSDYYINGGWSPHLHFGIHPGSYGAGIGTYAPWVHGYENPCCGGWVRARDYVNGRLTGYDSVPHDVITAGTVEYSGEIRVVFRIWNAGYQLWTRGGSAPVRLATTGPRDRGSGFADNGNAPGWSGTNRINLDADAPAGSLATFTATFRSNRVPGSYNECFSLLAEGAFWFPERRICTVVTVLPPTWRGDWYTQWIGSQSDPTDVGNRTTASALLPGDKRNLKLLVKNVGEFPWQTSGTNLVRLATSRPFDRGSAFTTIGNSGIPGSENWSSGNRPSEVDGRYDPGSNTIVPDASIERGEIGVFSFTVTAPQQPGIYREYFNPVAEGHRHFADLGMWYELRVLDPGHHYEWVTQSANPASVGQGTTFQDVTMQIRNTGQTAWPVNGNVRLGTDRPRDASSIFYTASGTGAWPAPNRLGTITRNVTSSGKSTVDPGEVAEFGARLTVPTTLPAGNYQLYVRPVKEGVTWFPEDYGMYFPINVTAPPYQHQVIHQEFVNGDPNGMPRNSTLTARLGVKNTGRVTWQASGAKPLHLGTERPRDRASGFSDFTGGDPWLGSNRPSGIDGRVTSISPWTVAADTAIEPGEIAAFVIPIKASPAPGTYKEYFNLVMEGTVWFTDAGIFFPFTVTP